MQERPNQVERLQAELLVSERRLNDALFDVLTANAELRGSDDEQQALNEELRVANEELEACETERQSLNGRLEGRVDALAEANSDMRSLIESTQIAIVFLDGDLRIRSFTPAVRDVPAVGDADRGRPVTDLALQLGYASLADDARTVLRTRERVERHAEHRTTGPGRSRGADHRL